jgi:hypothetical protein
VRSTWGRPLALMPQMTMPPDATPKTLADHVYPNLGGYSGEACADFVRGRCVLTPIGRDVAILNADLLESVPGQNHEYLSSDTLEEQQEEDGGYAVAVEVLNTISPSGYPLHRLNLKVNSVVIVLRNINPSLGMCNGTRVIVTHCKTYVVEGKILDGNFQGNTVVIPRIDFIIEQGPDSIVTFRRRQFPLMLAYAMTINKAQGQTLGTVGIYLRNQVFAHGQLYVALSRCGNPSNIRVHSTDVPHAVVDNVVYPEVLL